MLKLLLSVLLLPWQSKQHVMPPGSQPPEHLDLNRPSCMQSFTCVHTAEMVCGTDHSTSDKKWFLDECDMYEFNCDFSKGFVKIGNIECDNVPPIFDFEMETGDWRNQPSQPLDAATINNIENLIPTAHYNYHQLTTTTEKISTEQAAMENTEGGSIRKDIIPAVDVVDVTEALSTGNLTGHQLQSDATNSTNAVPTDNTVEAGIVNQPETTLFVNIPDNTFVTHMENYTETISPDNLTDQTVPVDISTTSETITTDEVVTLLDNQSDATDSALISTNSETTITDNIPDANADIGNSTETTLLENQTDLKEAVDIGTKSETILTETTTEVMMTSDNDISSTSNDAAVSVTGFDDTNSSLPSIQLLNDEISEETLKDQDNNTTLVNNNRNEEGPANTIHITCVPYSPQKIVDSKKLPLTVSYSSGTSTVVTCPTTLTVQSVNSSTIIVTCLKESV